MSTAMSEKQPFVTALRTQRGKVLRLGEGTSRITIRVQFEALWDTFVVDAATGASIASLVTATLHWFELREALPADFIVKLRGWEVKGADATIESSGAKDGSTFLVAYRFRRPIR